jgi:hypothetical protein
MLMLVDRVEISRGLAESLEYTEIGLRLGRDASVISRACLRALPHRAVPRERPDLLGGQATSGISWTTTVTARELPRGAFKRGAAAHRHGRLPDVLGQPTTEVDGEEYVPSPSARKYGFGPGSRLRPAATSVGQHDYRVGLGPRERGRQPALDR